MLFEISPNRDKSLHIDDSARVVFILKEADCRSMVT